MKNQKPTLQQLRHQLIKEKLGETDDNLISWHHIFNREYGWIPLEDFRNIPIATFVNLAQEIKKEKDQMEEASKPK